jgi:hypothetical protein
MLAMDDCLLTNLTLPADLGTLDMFHNREAPPRTTLESKYLSDG